MKSAKFQNKLGRVLNAYNVVTKFKENQFTFVSVIARKRSVTDRQTPTDKPKLIIFHFEIAGDNKLSDIF